MNTTYCMSQRYNTNDFRSFLFYFSFFLYGIGTGVSSTSIILVYPDFAKILTLTLQLFSLCLLLFKALLQNYHIHKLLIAFVIISLTLAVSFKTNDFSFVWLAIYVLCSEGVDFKTVARTALLFNIITVLFAALLSMAGVIPNLTFVRDGIVRNALGFLQPNNFGSRMLQISLAVYIIKYQRYRLQNYIFIFACAVATWIICNSRTSVYMMILLMLIAMPLANRCTHIKHPRNWIIVCGAIFVFALLFSLYFMRYYNATNSLHIFLNKVLSNRLYLMHYYYEIYPPSFLGQNLTEIYTEYETYTVSGLVLDNAYARLLEVHGLALTIVFAVLCMCMYVRAYRENVLSSIISIFTVFAIVGISEATMLNFASNYSLLSFGVLLFGGTLSNFADNNRKVTTHLRETANSVICSNKVEKEI